MSKIKDAAIRVICPSCEERVLGLVVITGICSECHKKWNKGDLEDE